MTDFPRQHLTQAEWDRMSWHARSQYVRRLIDREMTCEQRERRIEQIANYLFSLESQGREVRPGDVLSTILYGPQQGSLT